MDLTPQEIRDRISMTIACSSPETIKLIPGKIKGYVDLLEAMIAGCLDCGGRTRGCPRCAKADEVVIWARMNSKKVEDELQKSRG